MISNLKITRDINKKFKKIILIGAMGLTLTACDNEYSYNYDRDRDNIEYEKDDDDYIKDIEIDDNNFENNNNNHSSNNKDDGLDDIYTEKEEIKNDIEDNLEEDYNFENIQNNNEIKNEEITYDDLILQNIINSQIQFNEENLYNLNTTLDSINIEYLHSEYFEIEKAMDKYNHTNLNNISTDFGIINNNKLEKETIVKIIKNNNELYLKENPYITRYSQPSKSTLDKISEWICNSINYELENTEIDINSLEAKLSKLKVLEVSDFTYGAYTAGEELITYNINTINSSKRDTAFEETIVHEVKHLIQSKDKSELSNNLELVMGVNYSWDTLKVNSLYNEWLMESAAEKQTMNQLNIKSSLNYNIHLTAFDSMAMSMISQREMGELEKICMQSDLQKLYDYFGATTVNEKHEISLMMYAANIYVKDSTLTTANDFYKYYEEQTGYKFDISEKNNYRDSLRGSVGQTLSKIFYKNLGKRIINENVSVKDIFELIVGFELQISYQCRCYDSLVAPNIQDFYGNYNIMQQSFFEGIAAELNVSEEEVREAYQKYYNEYENNTKINILSENNQKMLKENNQKNLDTFYELDTIYNYSEKFIKETSKSR